VERSGGSALVGADVLVEAVTQVAEIHFAQDEIFTTQKADLRTRGLF
jgi:hypothetical protein